MNDKVWKRAIVVGASSGVGEATARLLAGSGVSVALVARRVEALQQLADSLNTGPGRALVFPHDVREVDQVAPLFQLITAELGGLDLVVYSSGVMPRVGPDEFSAAKDEDIIRTNVIGAIAWLNEAATRFSRAGSGYIIGVSSVAGDRGRAENPVYNASKAALNTYLEALRNRLATKGVHILTAKPGYIRTPMLKDVPVPFFIPMASPEEVASQMLAASAAGKRVVYIPAWWRYVMLVTRSIPAAIFEKIKL